MTRRSGASARAQALARAADAVARRDAERLAREKAVHAALAEFFQAQDEAARIYADAERAAAPFDAAMRDAVRALDRLGETRAGIAALTSVPLTQVREYLADDASHSRPASAHRSDRSDTGTGSSEPGRDQDLTAVAAASQAPSSRDLAG